MKKIVVLLICFVMSFTAGFVSAKDPVHVLIGDKEVENNGEYILKDSKVYVSQDALKRDFGFNVFYDKNENKVRLYDTEKIALESRIKLFEKFIDNYNPKTPDEIAELWAQGVKERNGVLQYSTLNAPLKEKFKELAEKRGSWVTGFSSPWIESYNIAKERPNESTWKYNIVFKAVTSASDTYNWHATLIVSKENGRWRIIDIQKDFDIM
ncbi:hypothetical protein [Clostridium aciditolerans]|uniref:Copper amine oxidase-like N-terminal domain-containing protein n=1 Tax=Clostridium aciditolerans TaxID=339861 RepID=A0A934M2P8_9CLOT|nr:hypothetical protein [Clostridium aciditolerans]MBI6872352.1 hypothetical protein [Clostridium aciditolerans]